MGLIENQLGSRGRPRYEGRAARTMRAKPNELLPTRASLLIRLKNWEDQVSWQRFFDNYGPLLYSAARQAGLTELEAQEVVQATLIDVAKKMPGFQYDPALGQFKGWLLTLTRWRVLDQFRQRARSSAATLDDDEAAPEPSVDSASDALNTLWEEEWQQTVLDAAIANVKRRVDPQNYQLFDFYVNKQWPAAKVASTFNVDVSQVYLSKHRCTELLKNEVARLEREGT
jgi:RNA polymerase sigma factor (sigma-70 family)